MADYRSDSEPLVAGGDGTASNAPATTSIQGGTTKRGYQAVNVGVELEEEVDMVNYDGQILMEKEDDFQAAEIKPASRWMSSLHLVKSFMGSGVFGLGFAFREVGWAVGIFGFLAMGVVNLISMKALIHSKNILRRKLNITHFTYSQVSEHLVGNWAGRLTTFCLSLTQFGFSTAYIIFFSRTMASIFPGVSHTTLALCSYPFLLAVCMVKNVKHLTPFSLIADIGHVGGIITLCVLIWIHMGTAGTASDAVAVVGSWTDVAIFFGIAVYAFEGIGVTLPIEQAMKDRSTFNFDLTAALTFIVTMFVTLAGSCYFAFGADTQDIIIKNLAPYYGWETVVTATALCVAVLFTYPISMFPILELIESFNFVSKHSGWNHFQAFRNVIRAMVVSATVIVAITVPKFGIFLALIGSLAASALVYFFPPLYELVVMYSRAFDGDEARDAYKWKRSWTVYLVLVMVIGVIGATAGIYAAVLDLVEAIIHGEL